MKKILFKILVLGLVSVLSGCGSKNKTPEGLIDNYITAVKNKDYESIWNMIPAPIQDYAVECGIVKDKEDALDYIAFSLTDYYWLETLELPAKNNVTFNITEFYELDNKETQAYLKEMGIRMAVDDACDIMCNIAADDIEAEANFCMVKYKNEWCLISVVGDDEAFVY